MVAGTIVLNTAPGRRALKRWTENTVGGLIDGRVTIGSVNLSVFGSLDIRDIAFTMPGGAPAIQVERLRAGFGLRDLLRGRFRFAHVTLVRPVIVLEQAVDGHWNLEHLFKMKDQPPGPHTRRPLVDLRDLTIADGMITIREQPSPGQFRVRVLTAVNGDFARLRPSHPDSVALVGTIRKLAVRIDNPALVLLDTKGDFALDGDSLWFTLEHILLPHSHIDAAGMLRGGGEHPSLDAAINATRFDLADFRGVTTSLPDDGAGRARLHARLTADGGTVIDLADGELRTGRSAAQGKGLFIITPRGDVSVRGMDLVLRPFDLALLAPYVDSLPARGLVRGRLRGTGPMTDLLVDADLDWADENTPGAPNNHVDGRGRIALGGPAELVFRGFAARRLDFDLGTIRHFAPSVLLAGRLHAQGTLTGPWRDAQFNGAIQHTGPGALASALHGGLRLGLADPVRVDADLVVDSLSLDLLRLTYPDIPLHDVMRGRVALHGPLTALVVDASLWGPVGVIGARGTIGVLESDVTLALGGSFDSLDLRRFQPSAPPTALSGIWRADLRVPIDSASAAVGTASVDSLTGNVADVVISDGAIPIRFAPERMSVEAARLAFMGGTATMNGGLGRGGRDAVMDFAVHADTLGYLEPLLRWASHQTGDTASVALEGAGRIEGRISGTTDAWTIDAELFVYGVTVAGSNSRTIRGRGRVAGGAHGYAVAAQVTADQLSVAGLTYAPLELTFNGPMDSLTVRASAAFTPGSSVHAQATVRGDSLLRLVHVDSMVLVLPTRTWTLAEPGTVRITPAGITLDTLELREGSGAGFVRAQGSLPLHGGIADFTAAFDSVSMTDIYTLTQRDASGIRGAVNGTLRVSGPVETPTMEARVALSDGGVTDYRLPLFQVLARYTDRRLTLKGGLWRDSMQFVTINGSLPLDLALTPVAHRQLPGTIAIVAKADSLDMSVIASLTDLFTNTTGRMALDVRIGGTWDDSRLSGFVDIVDGAMTIPALGARYTAIDARFELADSTVRVVRGQLHGGNGVLNLSGRAVFAELAHPKLDVTLQMSRFAAFDIREFGAFTGSGSLHLGGRFPAGVLTGAVTVDAGYLQFADLVQKRIVSLNDPEFRALVDSNLARSSGLEPGAKTIFMDSLRVDSVSVTMGNDVWLRSGEANIQLAGDFVVDRQIEGNQPRYRLDGTMRAVRGTYRLALGYENSPIALTKEFRVTRGTVRFFGTPDFNPEMDIVAENTVRPVAGAPLTVRVLIGGTLRYPRLTLESDAQPPLTQTEIVSYLVFGRPPSAGTGSEAALLVSVLGSAIGGVGQALVSELGLPLSYLTIVPGSVTTSAGVASTRVEAGVQIGNRTFLTLNAGLCEVLANQLPGAGIEYRFSTRWTIAAAFEPVVQVCGTAASLSGVTSRYQFGVDLNWQLGIR